MAIECDPQRRRQISSISFFLQFFFVRLLNISELSPHSWRKYETIITLQQKKP